ncbi:hypothetical protein ACFONC_09625 [Luteimonas soli]|uniref:Energy transducer TonB n=1 Tax=Luteimonas soli TaxID=1648966 RepID=A0ABV7XJT1_9GAMM
MAAVAIAAPKHVQAQTEASMLLTGTIEIEADGSVRGYSIDNEDKVPDHVLANIAGMVPEWRFEPVLVDGKPVSERVKMSLRMVAEPLQGGKFAIYIASAGFGRKSAARPTDSVSVREMNPPVFPEEIVRMGGKGIVYLILKIGRQGMVEDVAVEQVNLTAYASSETRMRRIRLRLAEAALEAARGWTFNAPSTGELADDEFWLARVPVDFAYVGDKQVAYGEWDAYLPGQRVRAPWLHGDDDMTGGDALAGGELQTLGIGPRLLTPLKQG